MNGNTTIYIDFTAVKIKHSRIKPVQLRDQAYNMQARNIV